jgi:hypothetical protein
MKKTWRADFFRDPDDTSPSRSVIISADSEDEAVDKAAAQMGDAVRIEITPVPARLRNLAVVVDLEPGNSGPRHFRACMRLA